ncbi:UNVERIFIED_CONTAM: hypothetical protein NCL1_12648 [Trichonephila clavipes]
MITAFGEIFQKLKVIAGKYHYPQTTITLSTNIEENPSSASQNSGVNPTRSTQVVNVQNARY